MKDEIKEILKEVNKIIDNTVYNEEYSYFEVSHISKLLDCITTLNEANKSKDKIIKELEYRLEKRDIKIITEFVDYYDPVEKQMITIQKKHIPAFDYYESL